MAEYEYGVRATLVATGRVYDEWDVQGGFEQATAEVDAAEADEDEWIALGDLEEDERRTYSVIRRPKPVPAGEWETFPERMLRQSDDAAEEKWGAQPNGTTHKPQDRKLGGGSENG